MSPGKPPSRDWRALPPTRSVYAREWRGTASGGGSKYSRGFKLRVVGFSLILLMSLIAILLLVPVAGGMPKTQVLTFGIGAYGGQTNPRGIVPINPFGEQDAGAFKILHDRNEAQFLEVREEVNALNGDQFLDFWASERSSDKLARQNLIVYCTMHGLVQPSGEVRLFAIDATPETRGKLIPLKDLVALLQECRARRVLLVLDAARLESSWRLGMLCNDIAEQVASDWPAHESKRNPESGSETDKVAILLAASPGQQSWPKEGRSALAHFLIEGLLGAADGWEATDGRSQDSGRHDQRIGLHELTEYARQQIADWSRDRYGALQTVELLGNTADFDLASTSKPVSVGSVVKIATAKNKTKAIDAAVSENATSADTASTETPPEVKWDIQLAQELWKTRDQWRDETGKTRPAVRRQSPLAWRSFEANLALAESLQRGGQEKLGVMALHQADSIGKRLTEQSSAVAGLSWNPKDARMLRNWGFFVDTNLLTREAIVAAGKSLLADLANSSAPPSDATAAPASTTSTQNISDLDPTVVREWIVQELRRESSAKDREQLRRILGRLPATPDALFLSDILANKSDDLATGLSDLLPEFFELHDRYRRLAVRIPESWSLVKDDIRAGVRALSAAERWMFAPGSRYPEVKEWLRKGAEIAARAERNADRYREAIGIWFDLLTELPSVAEWVAARANDDDRNLTWMRSAAKQWSLQQQEERSDVSGLLETWPEKPKRLTDVERRLLIQFVDAQRLKSVLFASASRRDSADRLDKLVSEATAHRRDFWKEFAQFFSPGELKTPSATICRESFRLLEQPWLPLEDRIRLDKLQREIESRLVRLATGDSAKLKTASNSSGSITGKTTMKGGVWQGFWATATLDLFAKNAGETAELWKEWDRLVELSPVSDATASSGATERGDLRKRRADLGQKIREQWIRPVTDAADLPGIHLLAAVQEPFLVPDRDPDALIRAERQRQFGAWLVMFSDGWRNRSSIAATASGLAWSDLAKAADELAQGLVGNAERIDSPNRTTPAASPKIQEESRPTLDAERKGRLTFTVAGNSGGGPATHVTLTSEHVRLVEGNRPIPIDRGLSRPIPAGGKMTFDVMLAESIDSTQTVMVMLTEADGYPLDFRQILVSPPFDPKQWRVEFSEATTQNILETVGQSAGVRIFLPPSAPVSLRATLVRPEKDVTPSASIAIYRLLDNSKPPQRELLGTITDFKLESGRVRSPIVWDFPEAPKEKSVAKEIPVPSPAKELSYGLVFQITPEGQSALEYTVRPTFYSAMNFVGEPKPVIANDRLNLALARPVVSKDGLLPKKIPVELHVPDAIRASMTDFTLSGSVEQGQQLTLSFPLPKNWSELARDRQLTITLDVAGLPHAYVWRIESSGIVTAITGQPPNLAIRMLMPPPEGKNPPRLKPVILAGKEPVGLQFQVNATELDRTDGRGDWLLKYTVHRESVQGLDPTPLQNSWQMVSSVQRHVLLEGIQGGVWKVQTQAADYEKVEPDSEIRGLSGRFQVRADIIRGDEPNPVATTKIRFAIDDLKPPDLKVTWPNSSPKSTEKDLSFQITASDPESGVQRIAYGFDLNGDGVLQEPKELLGETPPDPTGGVGLDETRLDLKVTIPKSKLPKLAKDKDEEAKDLIVLAMNGVGVVKSTVESVMFRKPPRSVIPMKEPTCSLVVKLNVTKKRTAVVEITGPSVGKETTEDDSVSFSNLKPGRYIIKVSVTYIRTGDIETGEQTVDIKADENKTVDVKLSPKR